VAAAAVLMAATLSAAAATATTAKTCSTDKDCPAPGWCINDATKKEPYYCHSGRQYDAPKGTPCTADSDCTQSYCLNTPPHKPPFVCHESSFPICADPSPQCQHMGSPYEVGCNVDADCHKENPAADCMNYKPHVAPYVCHVKDAPLCECACVSDWVGDVCQTWNGTSPDGTKQKANKFFRRMRELQQKAFDDDNQYTNPYAGWVGNGFDATADPDSALKAPFLQLTFNDPSKTWENHRLPVEATFTAQPAPKVTRTGASYATFSALKGAVATAHADITSSEQPYRDTYDYAALPKAFSYFKGDLALGVTEQTWELNTMALDNVASVPVDRYVNYAMMTLPDSYGSASTKAAFQQFFATWGTHVIVKATSGGILSQRSKYPYVLNTGVSFAGGPPKLSDAELKAQFAADFEISSMTDASGAPLSAAGKSAASSALNGHYSGGRTLDPLSCSGGNAVENCSPGRISQWVASISAAPVPIRLQLVPIWSLLPDGPQKDTLRSAVNDAMGVVESSVQSVNECAISCARGSCSAGACGCPGQSYGRLCDVCRSGYNGGSCDQPVCSQGCNAAGGDCTAPDTCQCHSCYAGANCMTYTCGCFDGEGRVTLADNTTVPLSQLRVGDRVLAMDTTTGAAVFSDVYYVATAKADDAEASIVHIVVEGHDQPLRLTDGHLVWATDLAKWTPTANAARVGRHVRAADVLKGMFVWVAEGQGAASLRPRRVEGVERVASTAPLVSVHTLAGPVVVDGVLASGYEENAAANMLEAAEARLLYRFAPSIAKSAWYQAHAQWWDAHVSEPLVLPLLNALSKGAAWTAESLHMLVGAAESA